MRIKFMISVLVLSLVFSLGVVQALTGENNGSQLGNFKTDSNIAMPVNQPANASEGSGGAVLWVPENESETIADMTQDTALLSGNFSHVNGTFYLNLKDLTPWNADQSGNKSRAKFNFTDPSGKIQYEVVMTNIASAAEFTLIDNCLHGNISTDACLEPVAHSYGSILGVGEFYVNGSLVNDNRIIQVMTSERVNISDIQKYRYLSDNALPHKGIETRLFLPDQVVNKIGVIEDQPVPSNYTLPDGQKQSVISIIFENSRFEDHKVFRAFE